MPYKRLESQKTWFVEAKEFSSCRRRTFLGSRPVLVGGVMFATKIRTFNGETGTPVLKQCDQRPAMKSHEEMKWRCFHHQHRQNIASEGTTTPWEFFLFQGQTVIPQGCNIYPTLGKPKHHFQKYLLGPRSGTFLQQGSLVLSTQLHDKSLQK